MTYAITHLSVNLIKVNLRYFWAIETTQKRISTYLENVLFLKNLKCFISRKPQWLKESFYADT